MFIVAVYAIFLGYFHRWSTGALIGGGDNFGYYCYLPAAFIHNDLDNLKITNATRNKYIGGNTDTAAAITIGEVYFKGDAPVIKYTYGVALLEAPAFFIAHIVSKLLNLNADGYSPVYVFCLFAWNLIFVVLGLFILSKVLLLHFNSTVVSLSILAVGLATNMFFFVVYQAGMSHTYLFTLYAFLIWFSEKFSQRPGWKNGMLIGFTAGMIAVIRPNEVICILIPVLWGVASWQGLYSRIKNFLTPAVLVSVVVPFLLCLAPQLIYWKWLTGSWLFYSYGSEGFDFRHPRIFSGLFGYKNGWLPYAPVMMFALAGILIMFKRKRELVWPIVLVLFVHVYVIYSWWCWNYINGLGSRPMIEMYPLLAIPLALTLSYIRWWKVTGLIVLAFTMQQVMLTWQSANNILVSEDSTKTFYWQTMFKTSLSMEDLVVLETDEKQPTDARLDHTIGVLVLQDSLLAKPAQDDCIPGGGFILTNPPQYTPVFTRTISECGVSPGDWIKVEFNACNLLPSAHLYTQATMRTSFKRGHEDYKVSWIRIQNKLTDNGVLGIWRSDYLASGKVYFYTQVPAHALPQDELNVFGWNAGNSRVAISNVVIEAWKR